MTPEPGTRDGLTPDIDLQSELAGALGANYEVRRLLGRGGFAEVFEVWDEELHRRLAVKVLRPDVAWTPGMLDRFRAEARAVARLDHPHILAIHFVGQGERLVYYAMPYVEGKNLGDHLRDAQGPLSPGRAIELIRPVLEALQHAHERGLVHRDIKPENIMLDRTTGRPMLMDFGIAKQLDGSSQQTQTGFVVGTPEYMSPEQALGQPIDARSDIYSLGAVLYRMVTGVPPFEGDTSQEIVAKHIAEEPRRPSVVEMQVPTGLSEIILRCLEKNPADRFPAARGVVEALDALAPTEENTSTEEYNAVDPDPAVPTEVMPTGESPVTRVGGGRRWGPAIALAAALSVVAVVGAVWLTRPSLVLENRLIEPVDLFVGGTLRATVTPGERVRVSLARGRPLSAHWAVVRPETPGGFAMGAELQGRIVEAQPRGTVRIRTENWPGDSAFFAPLITNATDEPLRITVNAGLAGSLDCRCTVSPGVTRASLGYYPLFSNSNVRATDSMGRVATFTDVGPHVERGRGTVNLRFESRDFHEPP